MAERAGDARSLCIEPRVVICERGLVGQVLEHLDLRLLEAGLPAEAQEGHGAEHAAAGDHRKDRGRARSRFAHEAHLLIALGRALERARLFESLHDERLPRLQCPGDRMRAAYVQRMISTDGFELPRELRVDRCGHRRGDPAVGVDQVDDAHLCELGHGRAGDLLERLSRVKRRVQVGGGRDEEFQPPALVAHALEREMNEHRGEQGEHDAHAGDRAELARDV